MADRAPPPPPRPSVSRPSTSRPSAQNPPASRPPTPRPTQAELDYVRALLEPLERAVPPRQGARSTREIPRRQHAVMTDEQLLAEYRRVARNDPRMSIPLRRLLDKVSAPPDHGPDHIPRAEHTGATIYSFAQATRAALRSSNTGPQSPRDS